MADQPITGLPTKTASGVASTDKMLGIDSAEGYQILVRDVAKYIIENCDVSTLAGDVRTPKAAIDLLNSNLMTAKSWTQFTQPILENGTHYGAHGCQYAKFGSFVVVIISVVFDNPPTNIKLWTMPSGYKPIGSVELPASGGGSYNAKAQCTITDSGDVRVTSVDKWVSGQGIFICGG